MTLVYDNTTCEQAIFTFMFSGQNLNNNNIVFTVKKLIANFKRDFSLFFEDDFKSYRGPKEYNLDELLGFVVMEFIIIVLLVENWLIGLITMMNQSIIFSMIRNLKNQLFICFYKEILY